MNGLEIGLRTMEMVAKPLLEYLVEKTHLLSQHSALKHLVKSVRRAYAKRRTGRYQLC